MSLHTICGDVNIQPSWRTVWKFKKTENRNSLDVQWLGHWVFTAQGASSISGWGNKIPSCKTWPKKSRKATS